MQLLTPIFQNSVWFVIYSGACGTKKAFSVLFFLCMDIWRQSNNHKCIILSTPPTYILEKSFSPSMVTRAYSACHEVLLKNYHLLAVFESFFGTFNFHHYGLKISVSVYNVCWTKVETLWKFSSWFLHFCTFESLIIYFLA